MKACPTNGLQPATAEAGPEGIWTPILVPKIGYCEYYCSLCSQVCPTGASLQRDDGIVLIDYDECTGCRACVVACPYQQRTFYEGKNDEYFPGQGLTDFERLGRRLYPLQKGTVVKCNFCVERIEKGLKKGLKPGVDREGTPACVNICPVGARTFGDLDDPSSEVSALIKRRKGTPFHSEFGTEPSVYYVK